MAHRAGSISTNEDPARIWRRGSRRCLQGAVLAIAAIHLAAAQDTGAASEPHRASGGDAALTVHGTVVNATTGQPVARALVKTGAGKGLGAFTDDAGRFAIHGVAEGVLGLTVTKPGFQDPSAPQHGGAGTEYFGNLGVHQVRAAEGMPDLKFSLVQTNVLAGQVRLSNGVPAQGIQLLLMKKAMQSGQSAWVSRQQMETNLDGRVRLTGVENGTYLLRTIPAFENGDAEPACNAKAPTAVPGFPVRFFPDADEADGAEPIVLANGQTVAVNLALTLTQFHLVQVKVPGSSAGKEQGYSISLLDRAGRKSAYQVSLQGDTVCAYLPNGSYTLVVSKFLYASEVVRTSPSSESAPKQLAGSLGFIVEGQPLKDLRLALALVPSTPVLLRYVPGPPPHVAAKASVGEREEPEESSPGVEVWAQRVADPGNMERAVFQSFPTGESTLELPALAGGTYRLHAATGGDGVCVGSVTAGGEDMARVPWLAALFAAGAPIEVQVRTDCASLTLNMPVSLPTEGLGEGASLYVYLIPEFDSVADLPETRLEQFGERTATLKNLTPGTYRVFSFREPQSIEFLNPRALEQLGSGQPVVVEPRGNATLTVEDTIR